MVAFTFDYNSWWFSALVFMLYCVYQFVFYEFFRYYPFTITILFLLSILIFAPFLFWPFFDIYHIFLYIITSILYIYISTIRIAYFNRDHIQVNKNRFNKLLHQLSNRLHSNFISIEKDFIDSNDNKYYYNKLTSIIIYSSLFIHILMFIVIDFLINNNIINGLVGILLLITIPIPNNIILPSYHPSYIDINMKYNNFELLVPMSYGWIVAYSLWILLFVFKWNKSCASCHFHIIILIIIPFIRSIYKKRYDLWYTSYLFGIAAMTIFTTPITKYFLNSQTITYYHHNIVENTKFNTSLTIIGIINIIYSFAYFMFYLKWIYNQWLKEQRKLKKQSISIFDQQQQHAQHKETENKTKIKSNARTPITAQDYHFAIDERKEQTADAYKLNTDYKKNHHLSPRNKKRKKNRKSPYDNDIEDISNLTPKSKSITNTTNNSIPTITPFSGHMNMKSGPNDIVPSSDLNELPITQEQKQNYKHHHHHHHKKKKSHQKNESVQLEIDEERSPRIKNNKYQDDKQAKTPQNRLGIMDDNSDNYHFQNSHYNYADRYGDYDDDDDEY